MAESAAGGRQTWTVTAVTQLLVVVFGVLLGAALGSFLNVVLWRVPRHESIVQPPSHCPSCGTPLEPRDLVPVLSWLVLRGRCRHCGEPIAARYPLVELACAGVGGLVAFMFVR
jgi:leader peptidase (prepilin peptidase)/N-methyltransferase